MVRSPAIFFPELYYKAAGGVTRGFQALVGGLKELTREEIQERTPGRGYVKGWSFPREIDGREFVLGIFLKQSFPLDPPDMFLLAPHDKTSWLPHVELDGKLCIFGPHDSVIPALNEILCMDLSAHMLKAADSLLSDGFAGKNRDHFIQEFLSYWSNFCTLKEAPARSRWSLLDMSKKESRRVSFLSLACGRTQKGLFAENKKHGKIWARNVLGPKIKIHVQPAAFLWLKEGLLPSMFPNLNYDLRAILQIADTTAERVLLACTPSRKRKVQWRVARGRRNDLPICFGFDTESGVALAGLLALPPARNRGPRAPASEWEFGEGNLFKRSFFGFAGRTMPFNVSRVDGAWLGFRGGDSSAPQIKQGLGEMHIAVIGAGSLGARVAEMLCSAGVGRLTIFDHDELAPGNLCRHILGADSIDKNKAGETARALLRRFPHLSLEGVPMKWETAVRHQAHTKKIMGADLILSTTGDLQSNRFLNRFLVSSGKSGAPPDTIFAWAEPFCCAGKAVLLSSGSACLECGVEDGRLIKTEACAFRKAPTKTMAPACGESFMPYGSLEMNPIASMVTKFAIEALLEEVKPSSQRVYVSPRKYIRAHDGDISAWASSYLHCHEGAFFSASWPKNEECLVCKD